jgi:hypothetical protein
MLESTVDLMNGLFLIAVILLTAVCIVCSIVAALREVSRGNASSERIRGQFVDDMGSQSGGLLDTKGIVNKAATSQLEVRAPEDFKSCASPQTPTVGAIPGRGLSFMKTNHF